MVIKIDNLKSEEIKNLITYHLQEMRADTPKESVHALDIERLKADDITFWSLWIDNKAAGCGALKELTPFHGEIKSMRTHQDFLRKGVAEKILQHIINEAQKRSYTKLSLETGSSASFTPAHKLYIKYGFTQCNPFGKYKEDPNSIFMKKEL